MMTFTSPLTKWPGSFSLPDYDDFSGEHWDAWRTAMEAAPDNTLNRRMCYAGLTFMEKFGKWEMDIPLVEVVAWKNKPGEERLRLVSWIGRSISTYIDELIDPKRVASQARGWLAGKRAEPFLWGMTLACCDFETGQARHFPAGTYYEQMAQAVGRIELDTMRLLWRCWLIFRQRKLTEWTVDDQEFATWLMSESAKTDERLNLEILRLWLRLAA